MSVASRTLRNRGSNVTVLAYGQALFAPGTDVSRWKNRFSNRIRSFTEAYAPVNKRPRWEHYGKPLKSTISANTRTRVTATGGFFYIAVGSSAPHAYYVDQGTGVYGGRGAYEAKVLPPWTRGGPSLYEHTWRPGRGDIPGPNRVAPVMIRGQKGQEFFDKGLKRGFESMQMRSYQVPGEGIGGLTSGLKTFPEGLANFSGNAVADAAFILQLEQWRAWRDAAWNAGEELGKHHRAGVSRSSAVTARQELAQARANIRASRAAARRRAAAQARALAHAKAQKAKARQEREAKAHQFAVENERRLARIRAQKYANQGYTNVFIRPVKNQYGTEIIGFDIHYTDTSGAEHVSHLHV